ncbi:hypothetical protein O7635_26455 [Asanoa sp. WMMD1127]|uniref:hypothetical protein n=1 Tax=Asanoa sp. WMMD1127 TaxID=3016107 RepID=UPI002416CB9E|nr:hypothetical protein [Asanoa sp. WMMD1127]MDG4825404.1 hypothetical protein [Asanoa sp. WMMD1127]
MADPLARRYRRLLIAYPRAYRRARGDELLGALLEAAPSDRTRPTPRETVDLLRHGLRARLGRPASRSVVAWAILTAVISGVFAAAFASRAAWETARPLPRPAEARAMLAEIVPGQEFTDVTDAPALFVIYGQPLGWEAADDMLLGDGGEYAQAGVGGATPLPAGTSPAEMVARIHTNLRAHGWTTYPDLTHDMYGCVGPPCDPTAIPVGTTVTARRGDTVFTVDVNPTYTGNPGALWATFQRAAPIAVRPAALAGGLAGAVVAFFLFGWASRRTEGGHPVGGLVKLLTGVALFLWWVPAVLAAPTMLWHHFAEPHPSWHPMWEWLGQPTFSLFFVVGCGAALLAVALAAAAAPAPRRPEAPVSRGVAGS